MAEELPRPLSESDAEQFAGRMYECCDIQRAIETGHFKTLDDVLAFVKQSASAIETQLKQAGYLQGSRSITAAEFELQGRLHPKTKRLDN